MKKLEHLLESNKKWAHKIKQENPDFFSQLSAQQAPEYLWIGCSDSRVPANQITSLMPGEVFVHRNIANIVVHSDLNCLSVLQFAVEILKVKHIIVCGHYGCGGIKAAMNNQQNGLIDNWLGHIKDVHRLHRQEIDKLDDKGKQQELLCEKNVIEQVNNVCRTTILQKAWETGSDVTVHGWIYRIEDGILKDLDVTVTGLE